MGRAHVLAAGQRELRLLRKAHLPVAHAVRRGRAPLVPKLRNERPREARELTSVVTDGTGPVLTSDLPLHANYAACLVLDVRHFSASLFPVAAHSRR